MIDKRTVLILGAGASMPYCGQEKRRQSLRRYKVKVKARVKAARLAEAVGLPVDPWVEAYRRKNRLQQQRWYERNRSAKAAHDKRYRAKHGEAIRERGKTYRIKNAKTIKEQKKKYARENADKIREYRIRYRVANVDRLRARDRERAKANRKASRVRHRLWEARNREYVNEQRRQRRAADPGFKLLCNLRKRLSFLLRAHVTCKTRQTLTLLGCDMPSFLRHIEAQFSPRMSWDNYGAWHLDHIVPCNSFDLTRPEQQARCFHFTNIQPLWAAHNRAKSYSIVHNELSNP